MPIIELREVYKIYDMGAEKVRALNGLDLVIQRGEYVAIMVPSGSGKSTLLHLLGSEPGFTEDVSAVLTNGR